MKLDLEEKFRGKCSSGVTDVFHLLEIRCKLKIFWWCGGKWMLHRRLPTFASWKPVPLFAQLSSRVNLLGQIQTSDPTIRASSSHCLPTAIQLLPLLKSPGEWCLYRRRDVAVILILCAHSKLWTRLFAYRNTCYLCFIFPSCCLTGKLTVAEHQMIAYISLLLPMYYIC